MGRSFIRKISIKKSISARTSLKRIIRHNLGVKAPRELGIITDPKKYVYNKVYNRTSWSIFDIFRWLFGGFLKWI